MTNDASDDSASRRWMTKFEKAMSSPILLLSAGGFLAFVVWAGDGELSLLFWVFALVPGLTGITNYIVTRRHRRGMEWAEESQAEAATALEDPSIPKNARATESFLPTLTEALAASAVLTGIFLIPAIAHPAFEPGLVYAGCGAYISTLWFMLARLNANALSPRFMLNSALKASIAMLIGFVASNSGLFDSHEKMVTPTLYFLIGLCHASAIKALRKTAMATFGVTPAATAADLSVRLLAGVDEGAADVLEELGITSVQHLATMHPAEVCGRSLYPRNRVLDWIDQAILVLHVSGRISELRAIGIHSAHSLVTIAKLSDAACDASATDVRNGITLQHGATQRLHDAALRLGISDGEMRLVARCIKHDPAYIALERVYRPPMAPPPPPPASTVVNPDATNPRHPATDVHLGTGHRDQAAGDQSSLAQG